MDTHNAFSFLITTLFDLGIFLFLTRFLLQLVQADFYNPISQGVVRFTHPILSPLQNILPTVGRTNTAALVMIIVLIILKIFTLFYLSFGTIVISPMLLLYVVHNTADLILKYFYWAIILRVILSWVAPDPRQPFTAIVADLTEPLMAPARRLIPSLGGLDFSPIIVLLALQFIRILIA